MMCGAVVLSTALYSFDVSAVAPLQCHLSKNNILATGPLENMTGLAVFTLALLLTVLDHTHLRLGVRVCVLNVLEPFRRFEALATALYSTSNLYIPPYSRLYSQRST